MKNILALFVGNKSSFSVQRLVKNISWMISNSFNLHLVTAYQDTSELDCEGFEKIYYGKKRERFHPYQSEYRSLDEYLCQHDPDAVVQLTEPPRHGIIAGLASKKHKTTFIYRYSGDRFSMYNYQSCIHTKAKTYTINNLAGRIPLSLSDYHIALGQDGQHKLNSRGVSEESIYRLPVSIDINQFDSSLDSRPPEDKLIPPDHQVILIAGWMSPMKGSETIKRVIPQIIDQRNDIHFIHVGPGSIPDLPAHYQEHVTSVGTVRPELMTKYYHYADLLLHASNIETASRVIMEAIAAGTPVLARDVGEISMMTDNTFEDEEELVRSVVNLEDIKTESIARFSREELKCKYIDAFTEICANGVSSD